MDGSTVQVWIGGGGAFRDTSIFMYDGTVDRVDTGSHALPPRTGPPCCSADLCSRRAVLSFSFSPSQALGPQLRLITLARCTTTTLSSLADPPRRSRLHQGRRSLAGRTSGAYASFSPGPTVTSLSSCRTGAKGLPSPSASPPGVHTLHPPSQAPPSTLATAWPFPQHPSIISKSPSIPPVAVPSFCP